MILDDHRSRHENKYEFYFSGKIGDDHWLSQIVSGIMKIIFSYIVKILDVLDQQRQSILEH